MINLQEFDTLEGAQAYKTTETKLVSGDMMRKFMVEAGLYSYFKNHTEDAQQAAYDNLFGGEFNFIDGDDRAVTALFQYMISQAENPDRDTSLNALLNKCVNHCNIHSYPFASVTPEQFSACKDAYSLEHKQEEDKVWNRQSRLRVTLHEDLYEPRMVTLFYTDDFFKHKNVGRPTLMHKAGEYLIDLKGVTQTGTLHINFGVKFSADCELV